MHTLFVVVLGMALLALAQEPVSEQRRKCVFGTTEPKSISNLYCVLTPTVNHAAVMVKLEDLTWQIKHLQAAGLLDANPIYTNVTTKAVLCGHNVTISFAAVLSRSVLTGGDYTEILADLRAGTPDSFADELLELKNYGVFYWGTEVKRGVSFQKYREFLKAQGIPVVLHFPSPSVPGMMVDFIKIGYAFLEVSIYPTTSSETVELATEFGVEGASSSNAVIIAAVSGSVGTLALVAIVALVTYYKIQKDQNIKRPDDYSLQ